MTSRGGTEQRRLWRVIALPATWVAIALVIGLIPSGVVSAANPNPDISPADSECTKQEGKPFAHKSDAFLKGNNLEANEDYYIRVIGSSEGSSEDELGTSVGAGDPTPVVTDGDGKFCGQLTSFLSFDNSSNDVYKIEISLDPSFDDKVSPVYKTEFSLKKCETDDTPTRKHRNGRHKNGRKAKASDHCDDGGGGGGGGDDPECDDGIDNDEDGRTDHPEDKGCKTPDDDNEGDEAECEDGVDNDEDGLTDHPADPDCQNPDDDNESSDPQCSDGRDNDEDGFTDFGEGGDPDCDSPTDDDESADPECDDEIDNDEDGLIDFGEGGDPDCESPEDDDESSSDEGPPACVPQDGEGECTVGEIGGGGGAGGGSTPGGGSQPGGTPGGTPGESDPCASPTIVGTAGDDKIKGTKRADVIVGLGGNDKINGKAGNDIICGGEGNDKIKGGRGDDTIFGDSGDDKPKGNAGADAIDGGAGIDRCRGGKGGDAETVNCE